MHPISEEQKADIVAAFEHSDRIREICLPVNMGYQLLTSTHNKSFLELEFLRLYGPCSINLPHKFMCGSTPLPRLRRIELSYLHIPALPQLLMSSQGLVSLHLGPDTLTGNHFISPEVLSTALSSTTQLEYLYIHCDRIPIKYHPELTSANSSPHNLVVLPALTYLNFGCSIEYLERLVSWIHAPRLMKLNVYLYQTILDVPQLSQFISRTEQPSLLPFRTSIALDTGAFTIEHHFRRLPSPQEVYFMLRILYLDDWGVSPVLHICAQLSPFVSSVKQITLSVAHLPPPFQRNDPTPWLQLLTSYDSVEEIEVSVRRACTGFACALQQSTWESARELLPALRVLRISGFDSREIRLTMLFAAARQLTGRPVIVHHLDQD